MKTKEIHYGLRRMGSFRAESAAAVQFNSILFRIIVGFMADVPVDTIALVTAIEFTLNWIFEVPAGFLSDRWGRVPLALLGYVLIIVGLGSVFVSLEFFIGSDFSRTLYVIHGFCIGLAKPLISGSVEAFYQSVLGRLIEKHGKDETFENKSFTLSQAFGKYIPTFSSIVAFFSVFVFDYFERVHCSFLIGIAAYVIVVSRLYSDFRFFGDCRAPIGPKGVGVLIRQLLTNKRTLLSFLYSQSFHQMAVVVAGYFIVTVGRELNGMNKWATLICFMFGYSGLGWTIKGYILPRLVSRWSEKAYLSLVYLLLIFISLFMEWLFPIHNIYFDSILALLYGSFFHVGVFAILAVANNMVLENVDKSQYALTLSLQNMPGFAGVGFYSYYLIHFCEGTPPLSEMFVTIAFLAVGFLAFHQLLHRNARVEGI